MSSAIFNKSYPIADAERGKFVCIDPSTMPGYTSADSSGFASRGRYALLTYAMGQTEPLSAVIMGEVSLRGVISADLIQIENVNVSSTVSSIPIQTNNVQYKSQTITANNSAVIVFSPIVNTIEIYNNDPLYSIYLNYGSTTFSTLTSQGLPLQGSAYYSINKDVSTLTLGNPNPSSVDVRVFGHYRS